MSATEKKPRPVETATTDAAITANSTQVLEPSYKLFVQSSRLPGTA